MDSIGILLGLEASLDWMVFFRLEAIRPLVVDQVIKQMFSLPEKTELTSYSHVILTSKGSVLASEHQLEWVNGGEHKAISPIAEDRSLYTRYLEYLRLSPEGEADCLAVGEYPPHPPVLLHATIHAGVADATAIFQQQPDPRHYELLKAVGVEFVGGEARDSSYVARYRNHLHTHILAGFLSHFTRTAHCNQFFLQHGCIDEKLEGGLVQAASHRVTLAALYARKASANLAQAALRFGLSLLCQPPQEEKPYAFGDNVPLGFLLKALQPETAIAKLSDDAAIRQQLLAHLQERRQGLLWSYHGKGLVTSTDSALILYAMCEPQAVEALEQFSDGQGGYYPQLWAERKEPGRMAFDIRMRHWCRMDQATTYLVRGLRHEAGLSEKTTLAQIAATFAERSGLYFANPYLVDWALAYSLAGDAQATALRESLAIEILSSMNPDYSFGTLDVPFSTSLAILALADLGLRGRLLQMAQLRLLDFVAVDGTLPAATPFYSTLLVQQEQESLAHVTNSSTKRWPAQIVPIDNELHAISFYFDHHKMITTAVGALALSIEYQASAHGLILDEMVRQRLESHPRCHPRYQCHTHEEYIQRFALPPYSLSKATNELHPSIEKQT